ncbi:hypothetical protein P3T43_002188 [Paraburkholderia sp. GAS41]|jgi:hypothetical protein|uniref:hypothetical protein n=1 Tax=Paraburkholderia sp. GAS41 TaxID=3035134 RepID=UPI003D2290D6
MPGNRADRTLPTLLAAQTVALQVRPKEAPSKEPLAVLIVQLKERDPYAERGGSEDRELSLSYGVVVEGTYSGTYSKKGKFKASYHSGLRTASLTSHVLYQAALNLDLPGLEGNRIGTYLMNAVVLWVKRFPPDTAVNAITLLPGQATADNKERRNRFYEQFDIKFDYQLPERRETGKSLPMSVQDLKPVATWSENIVELDITEYVRELHIAQQSAETKALRAIAELALAREAARDAVAHAAERSRANVRNTFTRSVISMAILCAAIAWAAHRWM